METQKQDDDDASVSESRDDGSEASSSGSGSPWFHLRNDATRHVSQTLQRGLRNLWQLTTSRVSVLLSSTAVSSTSMHQFLKIYEDLNTFILAGEAFCGTEAVDFRQKLKSISENYYLAFHKQNIHVRLDLYSSLHANNRKTEKKIMFHLSGSENGFGKGELVHDATRDDSGSEFCRPCW